MATAASFNWRREFANLDALGPDTGAQTRAARGRRLEKTLNAMFNEADLAPRLSFRPKGEEIDGSFVIFERTMLLEAKWTSDAQPASSLYQFMGKVSGKLVGTIGLFVSMSGFSTDAVDALIAGKELNLILMDGDDVRAVVRGEMDIVDAIRLKLRAAAETGTPYFAVDRSDTRRNYPAGTPHETILVEGRLDERIISTLINRWGDRRNHQAVVPVGGPANFGPLAQALQPQLGENVQLVIVADGGEPSVKRRIDDDLVQRSIQAHVVVMEPDLETALGIFEPGEFTLGRQKVLKLDDDLLFREIEAGIRSGATIESPSLKKLFDTLGIRMPQ